MLALLKRRPLAAPLLLGRAVVGRMNNNNHRRRRRAGSFSSVRAVFWPLMSMRSDADRPPPSPSLNSPAAASTTTTGAGAALAPLQAQLHTGEAAAAAPLASTKPRPSCDNNADVEEACRSFEKHLMDMLVERKVIRDLMDVEELLCCLEKLRSPLFVQLVARFYGELCMDLFSGRDTDTSSGAEGLTI
ncbi:hypothetical protein GUJ93_ZPchr0013g35719 [Zizania palustris]|uniref:OVATE domain-containing protein n=1 Tax=Zizania palustris TaxID=103762 RepID=A0A8J5X0L5_ZIZPA|nr:hypothetical protein GUJ93_ZPchr0013g35719 [Zizania palustris]